MIENPFKLPTVVLDFETYFEMRRKEGSDNTYSLKNMTLLEYIHDPRFRYTGLAAKIDDQPAQFIEPDEIPEFIASLPRDVNLICHNSAFDAYILNHYEDYRPAFHSDTLSLSRGMFPYLKHGLADMAEVLNIGHKPRENLWAVEGRHYHEMSGRAKDDFITYAIGDAELTYKLYMLLRNRWPLMEHQLIDWTIRVFTEPKLELDIKRAEKAYADEIYRRHNIIKASGIAKSRLSSNKQFAELLEDMGYKVPMKISPTTGKETPALSIGDNEFKDLWQHEELVPILDARVAVKSTQATTRAERLIETHRMVGKIPVHYHYSGAHTHRFSAGSKLNLQNLKRGSELRKSIIAPKGFVLVVIDSSQIEARFTAWFSEQTDLVEAFRQKRDVYSEFASLIYGREINRKRKEINPETGEEFYPDFNEGFVGKVCVLALGYQLGATTLQSRLALGQQGPRLYFTMEEAQRMVNLYRTTNFKITQTWKLLDGMLFRMSHGQPTEYKCISFEKNKAYLPNGMYLDYPALRMEEGSWRYGINPRKYIYGGAFMENISQSACRLIVTDQLLAINKEFPVVMTTHDEIVYLAKESEAEAAFEFGLSIMKTPPAWAGDLPLDAEGGWDFMYSK